MKNPKINKEALKSAVGVALEVDPAQVTVEECHTGLMVKVRGGLLHVSQVWSPLDLMSSKNFTRKKLGLLKTKWDGLQDLRAK